MPRSDAQRNRERLLAAATEAFREADEQVSLEEVARRAGVGIGTLYRNFPTRKDLLVAVYIGEIEEVVKADEEAADDPPWEALDAWLHRFAGYVATKLAMAQALNKDS